MEAEHAESPGPTPAPTKLPGGGRRNFSLTPKKTKLPHETGPRQKRTLQYATSGEAAPSIARCAPEDYLELLGKKVNRLRELLQAAVGMEGPPLPAPVVFESPREHFRMRATFKLWHQDGQVHYVMFDRADALRTPLEVVQFPMGSERLCALMPVVLRVLNESPELRERVDYCSFLTTLRGDTALVTLTYNRPIDEASWSAAARAEQRTAFCPYCTGDAAASAMPYRKSVNPIGVACKCEALNRAIVFISSAAIAASSARIVATVWSRHEGAGEASAAALLSS